MKAIFGGILLAAGILVAGGSGLCSLAMLFDGGIGSSQQMLPLVLLFGGIPFAVGAATAYGGYVMLRNARNQPDQGKTSE